MIRKYTIIFPILQYQGVKNRARKTVVYSIIEKKTNPNKWTTSASGHLSAGDESREGAVRELYEEIGVKANEEELKYLFTIYEEGKHENLIDREVVDVYLIKRDMELNEFKLQKEEVSDVHWVQLEEFKKL